MKVDGLLGYITDVFQGESSLGTRVSEMYKICYSIMPLKHRIFGVPITGFNIKSQSIVNLHSYGFCFSRKFANVKHSPLHHMGSAKLSRPAIKSKMEKSLALLNMTNALSVLNPGSRFDFSTTEEVAVDRISLMHYLIRFECYSDGTSISEIHDMILYMWKYIDNPLYELMTGLLSTIKNYGHIDFMVSFELVQRVICSVTMNQSRRINFEQELLGKNLPKFDFTVAFEDSGVLKFLIDDCNFKSVFSDRQEFFKCVHTMNTDSCEILRKFHRDEDLRQTRSSYKDNIFKLSWIDPHLESNISVVRTACFQFSHRVGMMIYLFDHRLLSREEAELYWFNGFRSLAIYSSQDRGEPVVVKSIFDRFIKYGVNLNVLWSPSLPPNETIEDHARTYEVHAKSADSITPLTYAMRGDHTLMAHWLKNAGATYHK